nr:LysR substrate-binding domain-containing protein [uncultured Holophaga sp.]
MDFRQFRYFATAAEELHFARAAERLGIAQPALSQQIKALEDQLGVRLFSRIRKRVALTEAGGAFLVEVRSTLATADRAVRLAQEIARGEAGKIEIGFVGSVMYQPDFPHLLKTYQTDRPGVEIQLHEMALLPQIAGLVDMSLDLAIVRNPLPRELPEELEAFVLSSQRLVAVLPGDHPLAGEKSLSLPQLAGDSFLTYVDPGGVGLGHAQVQLCRDAGFEPRIHLRLNETGTLVCLVAAGHGVSILPESVAHLRMPEVCYLPFRDMEPRSELVVIARRFEASRAVRELLGRMRQELAPQHARR